MWPSLLSYFALLEAEGYDLLHINLWWYHQSLFEQWTLLLKSHIKELSKSVVFSVLQDLQCSMKPLDLFYHLIQ